MKNSPLLVLIPLIALGLSGAGCGAKKKEKKEITELQRKEAAHLASEAQFALTLRDFPRAEDLLAKAVVLVPDTGELWISLASAQMKQGKRDEARDAYEGALDAYKSEAQENPTDSDGWLQQVYVFALLGRQDDARELLEKAAKQFPTDRNVRLFIEEKHLERMTQDPKFKEMAL